MEIFCAEFQPNLKYREIFINAVNVSMVFITSLFTKLGTQRDYAEILRSDLHIDQSEKF